jgi:AraC-like DNA-binding protein
VQEHPAVSEEALRLKGLLDSRVNENITTEEMAAALFRSKDYVIKLFRREFGETPHAYFLRQKMTMAGGLLAGTKLSVKQVAAALGYEDQHYFSNVFKKATGLSPLAYRKSM